MTATELELAAYVAAHRIYNGVPVPDRPCPGGLRSRMIDQIAEIIKQSLSVHLSEKEPAKLGISPIPETDGREQN